MQSRTLIVCAHMDDETLSCGALIQQRLKVGGALHVLVLSGRKYLHEDETASFKEERTDFYQALQTLADGKTYSFQCLNMVEGEPYSLGYYKALGAVEGALEDFKPTEVILPSKYDLNQDHRHYADIGRIALRSANLGGVTRVLSAIAFDSEWQEPTYYSPFSKEELGVKLDALKCYRRESRTLPHSRSPENIVAYHRVMGSKVGVEFAEAFNVVFIKE